MRYRNFLAPIHDYTDFAFRLLCQRYGANAACVPLVSAAALAHDETRICIVDAHPEERNLGLQLFGPNELVLAKASGIIPKRFPFISWLNLNCGCPSSRTMEEGSGSAMLGNPDLIARCVSGMKRASGIPLSVKIRIIGGAEGTLAICRKIEDAGADFIIIHGRTAGQGYSGKADWELIRRVSGEVSIPIVGNGDISSLVQGEALVGGGYCSSFMVGRAAMSNPMLFSGHEPHGVRGRASILEEYIGIYQTHGKTPRLRDVKLKALGIMSGIRGAARIRNLICSAGSPEEILGLFEKSDAP